MPAGANHQQRHHPTPTQPPTACCRGQHTLLSLHQAQHHSTLFECIVTGLLRLSVLIESVLIESVLLHGSAELPKPAVVTHRADTTGQTDTRRQAPKMCTHDWTVSLPVSKWCPTPLLQHVYGCYLGPLPRTNCWLLFNQGSQGPVVYKSSTTRRVLPHGANKKCETASRPHQPGQAIMPGGDARAGVYVHPIDKGNNAGNKGHLL